MPATATAADRAGLRPLNPSEEGTAFANLPPGVFGFTYAPLRETPLFSKNNYQSYELRKLPDGSGQLVAWVTPADAEAIGKAKGVLDLRVYAAQFRDATVRVVLPVERLKNRQRNPSHDDGHPLDLTIYPD